MRDKGPGGYRPWLTSSPCRRRKRGAPLSERLRLHRQGDQRTSTSPLMCQPLSRALSPLGRRFSVPRRHLVGLLRASETVDMVLGFHVVILFVETHSVGVDSCVGFSSFIMPMGRWGFSEFSLPLSSAQFKIHKSWCFSCWQITLPWRYFDVKSGFKIISWTVSTLEGGGSIMLPALYTLSSLRFWLARNARAYTSARSIGFCVIWVCISSSSSFKQERARNNEI